MRLWISDLDDNLNENDNKGSLRSKSEENQIENRSTKLGLGFLLRQASRWDERTLASLEKMSDQEVAVWYNDNVIYPDKVRLNCYYYRHYSFIKDIQMILCTVLGKKMKYAGETI